MDAPATAVHSAAEDQNRTTANTGGEQRGTKPCLQTRCSQQRSDVGDAAIVPIRSNRGFRPEITTSSTQRGKCRMHLGDASEEGDDTHGRHRRRPGKNRARFSSDHRTSSHLEGVGQHRPRSFVPSPPQRVAVVAARPRTADRPHGREKRRPPTTFNLAEELQPPHPSRKDQDRQRRLSPAPSDSLATTQHLAADNSHAGTTGRAPPLATQPRGGPDARSSPGTPS